jgi:hypothetical protein
MSNVSSDNITDDSKYTFEIPKGFRICKTHKKDMLVCGKLFRNQNLD